MRKRSRQVWAFERIERAFKEKNVTIGGPLVTFDKSNIGNYRF